MNDSIQLKEIASSRTILPRQRPENLQSLIALRRGAASILARRIAFPLLLFGAGLALLQPFAGQSGTWTATGFLITAPDSHQATLLPNGKVLVAGGAGGLNALASAELYDP